MSRIIAAAVVMTFLIGCAERRREPEPGRWHPASAGAMESPVPEASSALAVDELLAPPGQAVAGHEGHNHGAATTQAGLLYACPMHPDQTSDHPAACPKCGMKMKPKMTAATEPAGGDASRHEHHHAHGGQL